MSFHAEDHAGRHGTGSADPLDVTTLAGFPGSTEQWLRGDGSFAAGPTGPAGGSGDVVGPTSATDNALALFDGATGKLLQDSVVTVTIINGDSVMTLPHDTDTDTTSLFMGRVGFEIQYSIIANEAQKAMTFTVAGEGFLTLKSDGVDSDVRVHKDLTITGETTFNGSIVGLVQGDVVQEMHLQAGTTYTLADTDHGKLVAINNASPITLTVPSGLRADFECAILQQGAGQITFSASGTTINNRQSFTKTAGLHALAGIRHYWPTNTLVTTGDME